MKNENNKNSKFRHAVQLIELQRRVLNEAQADSATIVVLGSIIRHLNNLTGENVRKILSGQEHREMQKKKIEDAAETTVELSLDEVEKLLLNTDTTKVKLEAIAVGRFKVPRGSLRSIGKIENLRNKISTLIRNERGHETISSVVKKKKF